MHPDGKDGGDVYKRQVLVSVTKGIERGTSLRMSQILEEVTGRTVAVLSGPSHAEAVSYTHLDVYKRQSRVCTVPSAHSTHVETAISRISPP